MELAVFALAFGFVAGAIGGWLWYHERDRVILRQAAALRPTRLDGVADGSRVKIVGRVELVRQPLEAPLTGRACAAWAARVEAHDERWITVVDEHQAIDFVVRDRDGKALVRTDAATILYERDAEMETDVTWQPAEELTPRLRAFLRLHRRPPWRAYRYHETVLTPGERVTVVGVARHEVDPAPDGAGFRRQPATRVVLAATTTTPLWIIGDRRA